MKNPDLTPSLEEEINQKLGDITEALVHNKLAVKINAMKGFERSKYLKEMLEVQTRIPEGSPMKPKAEKFIRRLEFSIEQFHDAMKVCMQRQGELLNKREKLQEAQGVIEYRRQELQALGELEKSPMTETLAPAHDVDIRELIHSVDSLMEISRG